MKILPRTLLIAGCGVSLVSLAHAQSSALTLWGQVDSGITYISNKRGGSSWGTASGIGSPTRWGLRGNEDLGGGYRAVFALESGFNVNTGALIKTNTLFDRQAYVGLDGPLGTLTLGRQSDLMDDVAIRYSNAFWNRSLYSFHAGNLDSLTNGYQIENAVKYRSPDWYGVRVGALYGFAGSDASGHSAGAYATYDRGPLSAGVTYMTTKRRVLDLYNYFGWTRFLGQTLSAQQTFQSNAVDNLGIGLTYRIVQPWTINVLYTRTDIKGARSATHMQNIDAGIALPVHGGGGRHARLHVFAHGGHALEHAGSRQPVFVVETHAGAGDADVATCIGQRRDGCDLSERAVVRQVAGARACGDHAFVLKARSILRVVRLHAGQ
ncbi:porin [Burkholderia multivorans]|uniref:porin n=1 Tax=Burkholderia multivorans TaxID=87883 RepID=UPI0020B2BDB5|nr:porin [Burkholderia multivorans]